MRKKPTERTRCKWPRNPLAIAYHDKEWGVPVHDDRKLYEFLILEGAQAGLSWDTVLAKRENYRSALRGFDFNKVSKFTGKEKRALLANPGIVRNRAKIESAVVNARGVIALRKEFGSFARYVWSFQDRGAQALSKDLKKRGFNFVGPTIMYAFMQATGMVNDHEKTCFRWRELNGRK